MEVNIFEESLLFVLGWRHVCNVLSKSETINEITALIWNDPSLHNPYLKIHDDFKIWNSLKVILTHKFISLCGFPLQSIHIILPTFH